jgi:hypothetical protein
MKTLLMLKRSVNCKSKLRCKRAPIWGAIVETHNFKNATKLQIMEFGTNDENGSRKYEKL